MNQSSVIRDDARLSDLYVHNLVLFREKMYDQSCEIIEYLKMFTSCELVSPVNTQARATAYFRDLETNEIILETEYEYVGSYYPEQYSWIWAWYENWKYPNTAINLCKELVNYTLMKNIDNHELRSILLTPVLRIYYDYSLDTILSYAMSLSKKDIYPFQIQLDGGEIFTNYLFLINTKALRELRNKVQTTEKWQKVILELCR
jgi:uncharacterized iron-regulated protein